MGMRGMLGKRKWWNSHHVLVLASMAAVAILVPYALYAVSSSGVLNNNPERYVTSCNTPNVYYGSTSLEVSELDVSTRTVDIGFAYIFGGDVINPSVDNGVDYKQYPVYLNVLRPKQDNLPPPIQTPAQSTTVTITVAAAVSPLTYGMKQTSLVTCSGNSFLFPWDRYDFYVGLQAPIPDVVSIDKARTEYPEENGTSLPFGYQIYSRTSVYTIVAESQSNNIVHITILRPLIGVIAYVMPLLLLFIIDLWLSAVLSLRRSVPRASSLFILLIALIPIVITFLFTPTGIPRPDLFDVFQFFMVVWFSVLMVIATQRESKTRAEQTSS
jgi:hypothetical protein